MPLRSFNTPVLKWPSRDEVLTAAAAWARALRSADLAVSRVGVFGSYARGDAGVGSDLDLVIVLRDGAGARLFDVTRLPVPAETVAFEETRWNEASREATGIARTIANEVRWLEDE